MSMKVIVAGTRTFNNYSLLEATLDGLLDTEDIEIVSGRADGADRLGESYALEYGYPIKRFPADWIEHGKKAGPIRNEQMAAYAQDGMLVAFWDGISHGTKDMIRRAYEHGLDVRVIRY